MGSAASGFFSLLISAVLRIAVMAMVGEGRSPNVKTVLTYLSGSLLVSKSLHKNL